jgi:tetratricopeptide (TPR) repeat protein
MTDVESNAPRESRKALWVLLFVLGIIVGIYGLVAVALQYNPRAQASLKRNIKTISRVPITEFITMIDPNKRSKCAEFEAKAFEAEALAAKKDYPGMHAAFLQAEESCSAGLGPKSEFMRSVLNRQGQCECEFEKWQVAIDVLTRAIAIDPDETTGFGWRARAYRGAKQYDKAIADYNEALAINPEISGYYSQRGYTYNLAGQYQKSIDDYTKSLSLEPGDVSTYSNLAYAYRGLGQYQKTLEALNKGIELDPTSAWCYESRAEVYSKLGKRNLADKDMQMFESLERKSGNTSKK